MNIKERAAIYGGIAVAIVLAAGYRGPGNLAAASGETPSVRSADIKIGSCDVHAVADKLVQSDKYNIMMNIMVETLKKQLKPIEDELTGLRTKLQALPQDGAEFKNGVTTYQQKQQDLQNAQQQAQKTLTEQNSKNYVEAYNIVVASANAVGGKLGYTHIFASRAPGKPSELKDRMDPYIETFTRPLIKSGEATDITEEVIKDLKLDVAPAAGPTPVAPPVPAVPVPAVPVTEPKAPEKK